MDIQLTDAELIKILNADDLYGIMQRILLRENKIDRNREHFWVVGLEHNSRLMFIELISLGSVSQTIAEPMEVFSFALQKRASSVILVHNHPSGDLIPSDKDKDVTDRLIQVGIIVKTEVLDHLIITEKSYMSFVNTGLFSELKKSIKWVPQYKLVERIKEQEKKIREEATKSGFKAGMEKAMKEIVKKFLKDGLSIEAIAKLTGLKKEEVEGIKGK